MVIGHMSVCKVSSRRLCLKGTWVCARLILAVCVERAHECVQGLFSPSVCKGHISSDGAHKCARLLIAVCCVCIAHEFR